MRHVSMLLILAATSLIIAIPALADNEDENWEIVVGVSNTGTLVSPDARYCMMPDSMPIRPGNFVYLQDAESRTLRVVPFYDLVELRAGTDEFQPDEPCELLATITPVKPQDGLRVVIKPDPTPTASSTLRLNLNLTVLAHGSFDWSYDEFGYKHCEPLGSVRLSEDTPIVTTPISRLQNDPNPRTSGFISSVQYDEEQDEELCTLVALLDFPIADEYVIEFGGETREAE